MSRIRGERFEIDLSDDDAHDAHASPPRAPPASDPATSADIFSTFVKDVQERPAQHARPPTAPTLKPQSNGFPLHTKRLSKFKTARTKQQATSTPITSPPTYQEQATTTSPRLLPTRPLDSTQERREIDEENKQKLAQMAPQAIEQERRDLLQGLPPSLIERLLRRSTINDPVIDSPANLDFPEQAAISETPPNEQTQLHDSKSVSASKDTSNKSSKRVTFVDSTLEEAHPSADPSPSDPSSPQSRPTSLAPEAAISTPLNNDDTAPTHPLDTLPPLPSIHFPQVPGPPALDPSSPTFLTDLHTKYFPTLPSDPSKLAWMSPSTPTLDPSTAYDPSTTSLPVSALRFAFDGTLLAPSTAAQIPVTAGLHHHGDAPDAAGYTLPELAHLSRSAFPAQRCVAFQTLGRLLYRLGRGEFGVLGGVRRDGVVREEDADGDGADGGALQDSAPDDDEGVLARGMWRCIDEGRVLETLQAEVARTGGHMSAKAHATEALWLWQRGGGKTWRAE